MFTPQMMTAEAFYQWWIESRAYGKLCKVCNAHNLSIVAQLSIHSTIFPTCTGQGRVAHVEVPYCPQCEAKPLIGGCLHVSEEVETLMMLPGHRVK